MLARLVVATALAFSLHAAQAQPFSFGLWGDMPYQKAGDTRKIPVLIDSINRSDIAFSLYDGDIKDGSSKCTDDIYTDALDMFGKMKKTGRLHPRRQRMDRLPPHQ